MRYDVMNEYYTEIRLFGKPALFNDMRLDQETVPNRTGYIWIMMTTALNRTAIMYSTRK